jgi:hypothetical protein
MFIDGPETSFSGWPRWDEEIGRCHEGCKKTYIVSDSIDVTHGGYNITDPGLDKGHAVTIDDGLEDTEKQDRFEWIMRNLR